MRWDRKKKKICNSIHFIRVIFICKITHHSSCSLTYPNKDSSHREKVCTLLLLWCGRRVRCLLWDVFIKSSTLWKIHTSKRRLWVLSNWQSTNRYNYLSSHHHRRSEPYTQFPDLSCLYSFSSSRRRRCSVVRSPQTRRGEQRVNLLCTRDFSRWWTLTNVSKKKCTRKELSSKKRFWSNLIALILSWKQ